MNNNINELLSSIASRHGVSEDEVRQSLQNVIETAWSHPWTREKQQELFPEGKPSLETFLQKMANETEKEAQNEQLKLLCARDTITYFLLEKSKLSLTDARLVLQHVRDEAEDIRRWVEALEEDTFEPSEHPGAYEPKERIFRTETLRNCFDVVLLYLGEQEFDAGEVMTILQMVGKELTAMEKRQNFTVVSDNDNV